MYDHASTPIDQLILDRLENSDLPQDAADLVLAATIGAAELEAAIGGTPPGRPPSGQSSDQQDPVGTYLTSIEVQGFRGVGPGTSLELTPGPGLTIVTGRNGSGKSSFAEAAEYALTGDNKRWSGRTEVWTGGWRNLHTDGQRYIRVRLAVDGHRGGGLVEARWNPEDDLDDGSTFYQLAGERRSSLADLGWEEPLQLYRPFLSYSELGDLITGSPSKLHDSLYRILGLGRITKIENLLKDARKRANDARKQADAQLPALRETFAAHPDPRARQAEKALAAKAPDLDVLSQLAADDDGADGADDTTSMRLRQLELLALPEPERLAIAVEQLRDAQSGIDGLAETPADEARALAGLLRTALEHHDRHPDQPCPVCAGRTLDSVWAQQARAELTRLSRQAEQLEQAHQTRDQARRGLRELVPMAPAFLATSSTTDFDTDGAYAAWQRWDALLGAGTDARTLVDNAPQTYDALVAAVAQIRDQARQRLADQRQAWRPAVDQIRAWVTTARESRQAGSMYRSLHRAVGWIQDTGGEIRNERLAPIAADATGIWNRLRQESNVDLGGVRLTGAGNRRSVAVDVRVDGEDGAALGVMSQGELHALALALFLPRATTPDSPFRFLVIDDPVQSMDPSKVHGLAQVLYEVAQHRQVIVFTHDDRLPAAVRQLQLPAHVRVVSRRERSQVTVDPDANGDPAARYLDDAWAILKDESIDRQVRTAAVCCHIRDAIESACHDVVRVEHARTGVRNADTEVLIDAASGLKPTLALVLLGDAKRASDLQRPIERLGGAGAWQMINDANRGAHHPEDVRTPLEALVRAAQGMVEGMRRS